MATGCLDSQENEVACSDTDCSYGPCGDATTSNTQTGNNACLDAQQNPVNCSDPTCALGDCLENVTAKPASSLGASAAAGSLTGGGSSHSTSPLGIFSNLVNSASTAFSASQGASATNPRPLLSIPKTSVKSNTIWLLLAAAVIAFFAFGGKKALA